MGAISEITKKQASFLRAFYEGDVDRLKRLLIPSGYVHTDIWGNVFDRDGFLREVQEHAKRGVLAKGALYRVSDVKVRTRGDLAVLTCLCEYTGNSKLVARMTNVWVRSQDGWRLMAYHGTLVKDPSD